MEMLPDVFLTIEQYFATAHKYEIEPDYVDGYLEDRCVGEYSHASVVTAVLFALHGQAEALGCHALPSLSLRVSPTRVRIADVCLLPEEYRKPIPDQPPILCIEVLGSEDSVENMVVRCADYLSMGVPEVWILDPSFETAYSMQEGRLTEVREGRLSTANGAISIQVEEVFATAREG